MITDNDHGRGDNGACDGDEVLMKVVVLLMKVVVLVMMVMVGDGDGGEDISHLFFNIHQ